MAVTSSLYTPAASALPTVKLGLAFDPVALDSPFMYQTYVTLPV